jgi:hypothetical protein
MQSCSKDRDFPSRISLHRHRVVPLALSERDNNNNQRRHHISNDFLNSLTQAYLELGPFYNRPRNRHRHREHCHYRDHFPVSEDNIPRQDRNRQARKYEEKSMERWKERKRGKKRFIPLVPNTLKTLSRKHAYLKREMLSDGSESIARK